MYFWFVRCWKTLQPIYLRCFHVHRIFQYICSLYKWARRRRRQIFVHDDDDDDAYKTCTYLPDRRKKICSLKRHATNKSLYVYFVRRKYLLKINFLKCPINTRKTQPTVSQIESQFRSNEKTPAAYNSECTYVCANIFSRISIFYMADHFMCAYYTHILHLLFFLSM